MAHCAWVWGFPSHSTKLMSWVDDWEGITLAIALTGTVAQTHLHPNKRRSCVFGLYVPIAYRIACGIPPYLPIPSHLVRVTWIQTVSTAQSSQECRLKGGFTQVQELLDFPTSPSPRWPFRPITRLRHFGGGWLSVLQSPTSLVTGSGQHLSSKNSRSAQTTRRKGKEAALTDGSEDRRTEGKSTTHWRGSRAQCRTLS